MQKVILVQDHVLVLHPLIVQVETTRLDGLPGLGYRFEKACTNSGLRYALSNLSGGEDPTTVGSLHLEAVQGAVEHIFVQLLQGLSTAKEGTGGINGPLGGMIDTSKRTWSFPLPVQPWAMVSAPNWWAALTRCLVIRGLEMADTSG